MTGQRLSSSSVATVGRSHHSSQSSVATDLSSGGFLVIPDNAVARCGSCAVPASVSIPFPFGFLRQCAYHAEMGLIPEPLASKLCLAVSGA